MADLRARGTEHQLQGPFAAFHATIATTPGGAQQYIMQTIQIVGLPSSQDPTAMRALRIHYSAPQTKKDANPVGARPVILTLYPDFICWYGGKGICTIRTTP